MNIERHEIEKLANLARIAIDDSTINQVSERLGSVLELVDQLQAADTSGLDPMSHPIQATQRLRDDEVNELNQREALQAAAPDTEDGLFLVPKVIE
jgi:aspartyl-tRNA(Asn)/glutamyl-tRNA(Gln) amidotransferase subunit C